MPHGRTVCGCCGTVIASCRCPGPHGPDQVVDGCGKCGGAPALKLDLTVKPAGVPLTITFTRDTPAELVEAVRVWLAEMEGKS
ncbi:MAG TPA: hypothetical protein VI384_04400 [Candidatus Dormibacteraeota bacterium]